MKRIPALSDAPAALSTTEFFLMFDAECFGQTKKIYEKRSSNAQLWQLEAKANAFKVNQ